MVVSNSPRKLPLIFAKVIIAIHVVLIIILLYACISQLPICSYSKVIFTIITYYVLYACLTSTRAINPLLPVISCLHV